MDKENQVFYLSFFMRNCRKVYSTNSYQRSNGEINIATKHLDSKEIMK